MVAETLRRTPPWVFVLFVILFPLGHFQSKERMVSRAELVALSYGMVALSLYGVLSTFGGGPVGVVSWMPAVTVGIVLGDKCVTPNGVRYLIDVQRFSVPGSWRPLALVMMLYFLKYGVDLSIARHLSIANETAFVATIGACYGLLGGAFLGRAYGIARSAHAVVRSGRE